MAVVLKAKLSEERNGKELREDVQLVLFFMMAETLTKLSQVKAITVEDIAALAQKAYEAVEGS